MPSNPSRRYIRAKAGTTGITAAGVAVITAADAAAIRVVLELVLGTNVLAPHGNGSALTGLTQSQISGLVAALSAKADLVGGKIQTSQIPALAIVDYLGDVASQAGMLALDGDRGDWCIRTDAQTAYILTADDSTQVGSWIALPHPTSPVLSVNGQTGVIVLGASDVGAQPLSAELTGLAGLSATGILVRTGAGTFQNRTIQGTTNLITVNNGAGVGTNPIIGIGTSVLRTDTSQVITGQKTFTANTLTDGATINWDVSTAQNTKVTIAGSRTMAAPTNLVSNGFYSLMITQGGSGSYTITWNSIFKWGDAGAPVLSTAVGKRDLFTFYYDGTDLISVQGAKGA